MKEKIDLNVLIDLSEAVAKDLKSTISLTFHHDKTKPSDFKILKKLAKGGYGEVYVVEKDKKIYAMKKVAKQQVLKNSNTTFFRNEKEMMTSHQVDWLVKSNMCLQDDVHLYYIMEFVHGGDLMGYLSRKDIMKEDEIKFYGAEIASAINAMHEMGWIHRDLKPDNILLDRNGHVKLADFGSCGKLVNGKTTSNISLGTPDYISPDVLKSTGETVTYGVEVDFWTLGVILYEMFYGVPPFCSNSLKLTYDRITAIEYEFDDQISPVFKDLIANLLCDKAKRFDFNQLKSHKFFEGIDWNNLRNMEPPFKPIVSSNEDISNFVDTEFNPDNITNRSGYVPFIGFTHDPDHVSEIVNSIIRDNSNHQDNNNLPQASTINMTSNNDCDDSSTGSAMVQFENMQITCSNQISDLNESINSKQHELITLKSEINNLSRSKEELSSQVTSLNLNLSQSIEQISHRKDYLEQLHSDINGSKENLQMIKLDISEKMKFLGEISKQNSSLSHEVQEDLKDLKKMIARCKFNEKLDEIQQSAYWLYKQNNNLQSELKALSSTESDNKSLEDLKKQLRMQKSEIREYEQKIETEIVLRQKMEEELKSLRKLLKEASKSINNFVVECINANSNREIRLAVDGGVILLNGVEHMLNSVYIRDLKNNEMHHLSYKKRGLCILMYFLAEPLKTSSTMSSRRSLKALEADLEKEQLIFKSINQLIDVLEGKTKDDVMSQKKGSLKKIEQLKYDIENGKKSTISECTIRDDDNAYEFNSHLFYEKTVAKGSLCEFCNEVLYGLVNQAYCCQDCLLVVHKSCYVLVDVSCELNKAIRAGKSIPIICKSMEDKERLIKLNKVL